MTCKDPSAEPVVLDVRPLSACIGAEIRGRDLSEPLTPAAITAITDVLYHWKVVFFRDQKLDHAGHIAFARQFGELTYAHPYDEAPPNGYPEIYTVNTERFAPQDEGQETRRLRRKHSNAWHTDLTPAVNPPAASVLRAGIVPDYGGDTTWTNLVAAYEDLSQTLRTFLDSLRVEHCFPIPSTLVNPPPPSTAATKDSVVGRIARNPLIARHPLVRVHPITGERGLFVNPSFAQQIISLHPEESRGILALLFQHLTQPAYTVRFKWEPGSVAFWDNRTTAHLGPQDLDNLNVERVLHRVSLMGDVPVGVDGEPSQLISGQPLRGVPVVSPPARRRGER